MRSRRTSLLCLLPGNCKLFLSVSVKLSCNLAEDDNADSMCNSMPLHLGIEIYDFTLREHKGY